MIGPGSFHSFIAKVRGGDEDAARELVRHYEKVIRREVHLRWTISGSSMSSTC